MKLLVDRGFSILARNVRIKNGELDIVARDGDTLVFVEVKTRFLRSNVNRMPEPYHNLSVEQKKRIYRGALRYMDAISESMEDRRFRFDLIEVVRTRFVPVLVLHHMGFMGHERGISPFDIPTRVYHYPKDRCPLTQKYLLDS